MTSESEVIGGLLAKLLHENEYLGFLGLHVQELGIRVGTAAFLLSFDRDSGSFSLVSGDSAAESLAVLWVEIENVDALSLLLLRTSNLPKLVVRTGRLGQTVHPRVELVALRCFQMPPYPLEDRELLVYESLFGFDSPKVIWRSPSASVRILRFQRRFGPSVCVSSGFSDPGTWAPADIYSCDVSGAGYELLLRTSDRLVEADFSDWVQYVTQTGNHILPGNWLEFEGGKTIPGTKVAGFIVVTPPDLIARFPVQSGYANWHEMIPVDSGQLELAKRTDVFHVARAIREA